MTDIKVRNATDVFVADFFNASPKGELSIMEYPYFALSKKRDLKIFRYEHPKSGHWIEIAPSMLGRANIYDKDLVLYCTGQIAQARNKKEPVSRCVRITAHDYLQATHRGTSGRDYDALHDSLARLRGTTFKTNLYDMGGREVYGLVDEAALVSGDDGKMRYIDVVLGRRMFESILEGDILTYNEAYFTLSPNERRAYELARKHCGNQPKWQMGLDGFYRKFGSRAAQRGFIKGLEKLIADDRIPDYSYDFDPVRELVLVRRVAA